MGWTLPSTDMWQGEVFAISDCLVNVWTYNMYIAKTINVCTNFEINRYNVDEFRKYAKIVCFIWRHVTQKRYVVRHSGSDTADRNICNQPED